MHNITLANGNGCPVTEVTMCTDLLIRQGIHVADNLGGHFPGLRSPVLECALNHRHDEGQGRGVNEVDKLGG